MLGVCWYPEQWPEAWWEDDARAMRALGIDLVRIGEFSWSVLEPEPGQLSFGWLDRALDVLARAGLKVILGTPTATPPKWLIDRHPDILAVDKNGRPRKFGSRRHYDFSSRSWFQASQRIVEALAQRYGNHPAIVGWQTDNEFGCHNTTLSYSPEATHAFREFLRARHGDVAALNAAWGNRFWSQEYRSFDEIDAPNLTVTEPNPAHVMDFRRFSSAQVARYNAMQAAIIRAHAPGRFVTHNFMGGFTEFDHYAVMRDLDFASWDSYPLGFTDVLPFFGITNEERLAFATTGHPDMASFHHDLYAGMSKGRGFYLMEQQPGPVNWALWNPAPAPGMVRLWTWEAFAHGAEAVCYFRWRQAPFAQEQMHAGLNRPDRTLDTGGEEAGRVARELGGSNLLKAAIGRRGKADAAIVFDYPSLWALETQPQGADWHGLEMCFQTYGALRRLGLNVDIVRAGEDLSAYPLIVAPSLVMTEPDAVAAFASASRRAVIVLGPRAGSKTEHLTIPQNLAPGALAEIAGVKVTRVESLRPGLARHLTFEGKPASMVKWAERVEPARETSAIAAFADGTPAITIREQGGAVIYLAGMPDRALLASVMAMAAARAKLVIQQLPATLRLRKADGLTFAFNYADKAQDLGTSGARFHLGENSLSPFGVAAWE